MGIIRKLRVLNAVGKAANEAATAAGAPPGMQRGMAAGFANVMAQVLAPHVAATAERRGGPLPGSDPGIADGSAWLGSVAAGSGAIKARDAAFDPVLLASFSEQVFAAVAAVWLGTDCGTVRPVMSDQLWEPIAAATGTQRGKAGGLNPLAQLGQQEAAAEIAGLHAGAWYDSAMIVLHVHLAGPLPAELPPEMADWDEDWLFQRSRLPGGNPMIRPGACPACGAPSRVGDSGQCLHCQVPIPFLTAGWLVTSIVSHHPSHALKRERLMQAMAADPGRFANVPPAMRQFLPADLTEILAANPDRGQAPGSEPRSSH